MLLMNLEVVQRLVSQGEEKLKLITEEALKQARLAAKRWMRSVSGLELCFGKLGSIALRITLL